VGGFATIFSTRSRTFSFLDHTGVFVGIAFIVAQIFASVIGAYGLNGYNGFGGAGWGYVLVGWVWSIIWFIPMDCGKVALIYLMKTKLLDFSHLHCFHHFQQKHQIHKTNPKKKSSLKGSKNMDTSTSNPLHSSQNLV